ncbi:MAG: polymerase ECF-type sigma factor, partial [Microvirga sp.]|nr:polymerase ECF-type sigma factor [Microvirga sp.]
GKILAFINPITGIERVLRLYRNLHRKFGDDWMRLVRPIWIDGLPGYITHERGDVLQTTAFAIEDGRITNIYITRNPDKLQHVVELLSGRDGAGRTQ